MMRTGYLARKRRLRHASSGPELAREAWATLLREGLATLEADLGRMPTTTRWAAVLVTLRGDTDFDISQDLFDRATVLGARAGLSASSAACRAVEVAGQAIERSVGRTIMELDAWSADELAILARRVGWIEADVPAEGEVLTAALLRMARVSR